MPNLQNPAEILVLWAVFGYLLGSIPFGVLLARVMGLGNLRDLGSGSIGATNVLRTGSKTAAILTLVLDGGKGAVAFLVARAWAGEDAAQIAGLLALVGHCYPIWLKFKGGKGVATFFGLMLVLAWPVGVACCATWLVVAALSRISSLAGMTTAASAILWSLFMGYTTALLFTAAMAVLIIWRHSDNIKRLSTGTEPKIGQR